MDSTSDGTESQIQVPSSKPRPPPVSKKPKPSVAKKPALAEKPSILPKKPSLPLNGSDEHHSAAETNNNTSLPISTNTSKQPDLPGPSDPDSAPPAKSTALDSSLTARPKEPPPLPTSPPNGPVHQKTPPPLPKNPPKGQVGVKAQSQSSKLPVDKPVLQNIATSCKDIIINKTNLKNDIKEENIEKEKTFNKISLIENKPRSVNLPVKPKPRQKTVDSVNPDDNQADGGKELDSDSDQFVNAKDIQKTFLEREVSVGNSTWFHSGLVCKHGEIYDFKDEPESSLTNHSDEVNISQVQNHVLNRVTSVGKSTWFGVETIISENKKGSKSDKVRPLIESQAQKENNLDKFAGDSSPAPNRTPPPVPKKLIHKLPVNVPNTTEQTFDDSNSAAFNNKSSSCDTQENVNCEPDLNKEGVLKVESAIKAGLKSGPPKPKPRASISSAESAEKLLDLTALKPVPKPRPTPKKRSSVNRLSGSEEFSQSIALTGNSENSSRSSTAGLQDYEPSHETEESVSVKTTKSDNATVSYSKSKIISAQNQEKQYRVIDKSVLGASNQKPKNISNEVNVIEKNVPQNTVNSNSLSVAELRKNFKESKQLDAQIDVPNTHDDDAQNIVPNKKEDGVSSSDHTPSSLKDSFEDFLSDKSILEPSSLLTEIEEILSRSYKYSSLTRSGSSPEKKGVALYRDSSDIKHERSLSLDLSPEQKTSTPIRPPRPKKEAKRLRSRSQIVYDACASDTESLPDLSVTHDEEIQSSRENFSKACTLGPAKPHPPKPKRNKLLKVQRSHSDISKMKSFLEQKEIALNNTSPIINNGIAASNENVDNNSLDDPVKTARAKRPTRKAPPPPTKVDARLPSLDLNVVVPVDSRVKSLNMEKRLSQKQDLEDTAGSIYDSIKDVEVSSSSDEDHDYHEIPEHLRKKACDSDSRSKSGSPPKLPPRNYSNSNSFDSSSQSGFACEISLVDTGSSAEDLSLSSAMLKTDSGSKTSSPLVKKRQVSKPITSPLLHRKLEEVQNLAKSGLSGSNLSLPESLADSTGSRTRPVSNASEMTVTSSESEGEDEETKITRKKEKKLFLIAQEVFSSERVFVDVLKLLNVDFRKHISDATEHHGRPVIPSETLNRILDYLPQLQNFNEDLLKDLEERLSNWDTKKGIADIFVKKGPFLKLYTSYIRDFETMTATLDEAVKRHALFQAALKEFEMSPRCASLALRHYMLKPIQRIPQYRLLLQDYMKHLPSDSPEMKEMQTALNIVSEVAVHANDSMGCGYYVQKMLGIQRSLIGQFEVIKPGRTFLKEGELMKLSRKEMQPRFFFLFNDVLLYTTPAATGYKLNNVLSLAGMKVSVSAQDDFKNEFSIVSVQRSFTLAGETSEERDDWVNALNSAIDENAMKRNTFEAVRAGAQTLLDKDFVLGHKCPIWIPDARVTMCMLCTCEFTLTWRRHHCRACGRVVCGSCSDHKAPLRYLKYKEGRVCDECYKILISDKDSKDGANRDRNDSTAGKEADDSWLSINGLFERFTKLRISKGADKKLGVHRPKVLTEVTANDQGATMSGYLNLQKGRTWKKLWFVLKDKVLYHFKATQDQAAAKQTVLLGYEVVRFTEFYDGYDPELLFQLTHSNIRPIVFRTESASSTEKWITKMREASIA